MNCEADVREWLKYAEADRRSAYNAMKGDDYFDNVTLCSEGVCDPRLWPKMGAFSRRRGSQTRLEPSKRGSYANVTLSSYRDVAFHCQQTVEKLRPKS